MNADVLFVAAEGPVRPVNNRILLSPNPTVMQTRIWSQWILLHLHPTQRSYLTLATI
ncbi:MAG: hypothetical protein ABI469_09040 [Gemmatimonadales bacterium]